MRSHHLSRRALLQALTACAVTAALPVKRARAVPAFLNDPFQLGVASGDAVADGFVIWTRLAPDPFDPEALPQEAIPVAWEVAADKDMKRVVAHGNVLADGDCVVLIKDLKLGGSSVLKGGSKSKPIRLIDGDHEIDCKVDGIGVRLKACFVKKA